MTVPTCSSGWTAPGADGTAVHGGHCEPSPPVTPRIGQPSWIAWAHFAEGTAYTPVPSGAGTATAAANIESWPATKTAAGVPATVRVGPAPERETSVALKAPLGDVADHSNRSPHNDATPAMATWLPETEAEGVPAISAAPVTAAVRFAVVQVVPAGAVGPEVLDEVPRRVRAEERRPAAVEDGGEAAGDRERRGRLGHVDDGPHAPAHVVGAEHDDVAAVRGELRGGHADLAAPRGRRAPRGPRRASARRRSRRGRSRSSGARPCRRSRTRRGRPTWSA